MSRSRQGEEDRLSLPGVGKGAQRPRSGEVGPIGALRRWGDLPAECRYRGAGGAFTVILRWAGRPKNRRINGERRTNVLFCACASYSSGRASRQTGAASTPQPKLRWGRRWRGGGESAGKRSHRRRAGRPSGLGLSARETSVIWQSRSSNATDKYWEPRSLAGGGAPLGDGWPCRLWLRVVWGSAESAGRGPVAGGPENKIPNAGVPNCH